MENTDRDSYAALRHGGAPQGRACAELGVSSGRGQVLEALFRARRGRAGPDSLRPRFARHEQHVKAVRAAGGYPVLR